MGKCALFIAIALSVAVALAQDDRGGRGDFGGRGGGGRGGFGGGGFGGRGGGGRGGGGGGGGMRGPRTPEQMAQFTAMIEARIKQLDTNGNGMIDAEEVSGPQKTMVEGMFRRMQIEPKYPIAISEIMRTMEKSMANQANGAPPGGPPRGGYFGVSANGPPGSSSASDSSKPQNAAASPASPASATAAAASTPAKPDGTTAASADPKKVVRKPSSRFLTTYERVTGLPEWFVKKDADGDGQVTMAEFASEWTPELLSEFNRYDLNRDGVITAAECLKVEKRSNQVAK
jgi:Ca2+-binding EF-hand superfamily protein